MVRVENNIRSRFWVSSLIVGMLTGGFVGCSSDSSQTPAPTATATAPTDTATQGTGNPAGKPKVEIIGGETYDFGTTEVGQKFDHVFEIKNVGTADLTLEKRPPSCSTCTSFEIDKTVLKPNEIAKATVKWHIQAENPEFRQYAPFKSNDPDKPDVKMYVVGKVVKKIVMEPNPWNIGEVAEGQPKEFVATVTSATTDKLEVESIKTDNPKLTVTSAPMTAEKLAELKIKSGYYLKAVLDPEIPAGEFTDQVTVKLRTPDPLELTARAMARRSGPLQIFGPGWHAERMQLALAAFDPKQPLVTRLFLNTRGVDGELKFVKVECTDDRFSFELKPDEKFKGAKGDYRRYEFFVKVAPRNTAAVYTALKPLKVDITTNQDKIKQINMKITCQAIP